ncbi:MAG: Rpn family recombination-promoting nuclease/putative transposase [Gammaproteobacteria bacterium]|nr:Rpn family recombination-promoting nuclease/putative transposase [Gammaproteobacteria bacterium]
MHDPFLKSVFADRRMIEILIRDHAPEWADEIDFSTLREEPTELVSRKTLERRHPDMIWSADTADGGRVVFLIEFQREVERLMALRTTTYTALALERIVGEADIRSEDPLPEFVYLVLYHGDGPWSGPTRVDDLFQRSQPGRFRLVSWRTGAEVGDPRDDTTALVLGLARSLSMEEMAAQVDALRLRVRERGDASLDVFMVERMGTMLRLRDYPEELKLGGAKTMTELVDRFHRSLDELVQRGARQGRRQVLRRQIVRRFGEATAEQVSDVLEGLPDPEGIDRVTDALVECGTGEEFIERVRMA